MIEATPTLRIFIEYEYLAAEQLGQLLLGLHGVFDELLYADAPHLRQLPSAGAARLRIDTVETGNSITLHLIQGITQLVGSRDPAMVGLASGVAALTATGTIVLRLLSRAEDLRAKWMRDNRMNERQQLELAEKRLDLVGKEIQLRALAALEQQTSIEEVREALAKQNPNRPPEQQNELAAKLVPHLDAITQIVYGENIRSMSITSSQDSR